MIPPNVSVYFCKKCENYLGVFYHWYEIDNDWMEPVVCSVCESDNIDFIKDINTLLKGE